MAMIAPDENRVRAAIRRRPDFGNRKSNIRSKLSISKCSERYRRLDVRDHVGKLVRRLDADRDCRTPPQRRPTMALDAGTDASTLVERLAVDLHGLDYDLPNKGGGELAYRAATACEALARVLREAERAGWRSPHRV
jgi:hypothetical protein